MPSLSNKIFDVQHLPGNLRRQLPLSLIFCAGDARYRDISKAGGRGSRERLVVGRVWSGVKDDDIER